MSLSTEQSAAISKIIDWIKRPAPSVTSGVDDDSWMFVLQGFAGTGKTYLLKELISDMHVQRFHCAAPTGKAAAVMMSKMQGVEAVTLHRLLYHPVEDDVLALKIMMAQYKENPTDELKEKITKEQAALASKGPSFRSKDQSEVQRGDLVIVDEASMMDQRILNDLKATGCKALLIGDPGQLPPVGSTSWFIDRKPDAMLETIQRQALDNPIIQFSMEVRQGTARPKDWRRKPGCGIFTKDEVDTSQWLEADQIITGSNASRRKINRFFRKQLKFFEGHYESQFPRKGERLICLKNNYGTLPQQINGTQFVCTEDAEITDGGDNLIGMEYEGVVCPGVMFYDFHCLATYDKDLTELPREFRKGLMELDYAYAITVHKSQGSEWGHVIIADDRMQAQNAEFRRRWLYTAITRAKTSLTVIQ